MALDNLHSFSVISATCTDIDPPAMPPRMKTLLWLICNSSPKLPCCLDGNKSIHPLSTSPLVSKNVHWQAKFTAAVSW